MNPNAFEYYKNLLKQKSGLVITPDKAYLLDSRLTPIAKKHGIADIEVMADKMKSSNDATLINAVVEAMTTNETSFFRDARPFDMFRDVLMPEMLQRRANSRRIRIWSAACSSGQEPYTLAMLLKEMGAKLQGWTIEIVATDISHEILEQAKKAQYSQFEVQRGLPIQLLMKYFDQAGDKWALSEEIKKMVQFKYFNLLDPFTAMGPFDIVFCRNVLIYFDTETKTKIFEKLEKVMAKDSFLLLGGAETVFGITDLFKSVPDQRGLYMPSQTPTSAAQASAAP